MKCKEAISQLIKLSEDKFNVLVEFYKLTEIQKKEIENKEDQYLLYTIEKKQENINYINQLDEQFCNTFSNLKNELNINSIEEIDSNEYADIKELKAIVDKILMLTHKIQEIDKSNVEEVKKEMQMVKEEMKNIKNSARANMCYNNMYKHSQGVFIDNKK